MTTIEFTGKTTTIPFDVDVDGRTYIFDVDDGDEYPSAEVNNEDHAALLVSAGCYKARPEPGSETQAVEDGGRPARPRKAA